METLPALEPGTKAPSFELVDTEGRKVSLEDLLKKGPTLLIFYKRECPVCRDSLPFFKKYTQYVNGFSVVGIAQNTQEETVEFAQSLGLNFPILLDSDGYKVSKAYGLTNVPTLFLIGQDGVIKKTVVSWNRQLNNEVSEEIAKTTGKPVVVISQEGDGMPDFRPG